MDEVIIYIYIPMKYIGVCNVMVSSVGKRNVNIQVFHGVCDIIEFALGRHMDLDQLEDEETP